MTRRSKLLKASGILLVMVLMAFMPIAMSTTYEEPSDEHEYCGEFLPVDLIAGQNIDAGDIIISNDKDYVYVEFFTHDGWYLVETHVAAGDDLSDIPQTNKNKPIPGQFELSETYSNKETYDIFMFDKDDFEVECGEEIYIAAHAVVRKDNSCGYDEQTGWGEGPKFNDKNWAMYIVYELQCCFKRPDIPETADITFVFNNYATPLGSYWKAVVDVPEDTDNIWDGNWPSWCIQHDTAYMTVTDYDGIDLIYSYDHDNPDLPGLSDGYHWDWINWILNNNDGYTGAQIQNALWYCSGHLSTPNALAQAAVASGTGFVPASGDDVAIYVPAKQPVIIVIDP